MSDKVFIVGEIGVNHSGSLETARFLVNEAVDAKVDAVKLQAWYPSTFPGESKWLLTREHYKWLFENADAQGLEWYCTAFDLSTMHWLRDMGMCRWKIPSGMVTNTAYLEAVREMPGEFILSTGMCARDEIFDAWEVIGLEKHITALHCTTAYPAPLEELNLFAMQTMRHHFGRVGLSDHSGHVAPSVAAVALGASMIEVHITLDKNAEGPDHKASLDPEQLRRMVRMVRQVEQALGDGVKRPTESELKVRDEIRRSMGCNSGS